MKKYIKVLLLLFLSVPLLTGCWNQEELPNLAFVMALGVDKAKNNQGYTLTFEIVNPGNVAASQMGGGQGVPVAVYKSTGKSLFDATRKASKKLSRKIYFAHTNAVVISEQVAKDGVLDLLDILDRDPIFRTTTQLFIAKDTSAENVVSTLTILDKIPVNKIVKSLNVTEAMLGENMKVTIDDFIKDIVSSGKEPFTNGVILPGNQKLGDKMSNIAIDKPGVIIEIDGLALFKGGKLIGWIDGNQARGVVWTLNKVNGTDVFVDWQGKKKAIGVIIRRSNAKFSPSIRNGKPFIQVAIKAEADIEQVNTSLKITDPAVIKKLEDMVGEEVKKEVRDSIKTVQSKKSDIFGFGDSIHRAYPKKWKNLKSNWNKEFSTLDFSVKSEVYLRRHGIRNEPFLSDINK
ncbi:MAG: Ger(x)C family spore germination protein [Bacillota bacterium]|nr:Ger(x)C family spore germination protein [Bacillota bacterium]